MSISASQQAQKMKYIHISQSRCARCIRLRKVRSVTVKVPHSAEYIVLKKDNTLRVFRFPDSLTVEEFACPKNPSLTFVSQIFGSNCEGFEV